MNGYELTRQWWDFAYNSGHPVKPEHHAVYLYAVELCNRLGWKQKFAIPTTMTMEAVGIRSYKTYINVFRDLCEWGVIQLHEKSTNQYSANVIALVIFTEAQSKALDKAILNHVPEQVQSTDQSRDSIIKQQTTNKKPQTNTRESNFEIPTLEQLIAYADEKGFMDGIAYEFFEKYTNLGWKKQHGGEPIANWKLTMQTWMKRDYNAKWKKQTTTGRTILPSGTKFFES